MSKPRGRSSQRDRLQQYFTHLIYAEGSKTEPKYIENIKQILDKIEEFKQSNIIIKTNPKSGGRSTLELINFAEKDIKKRIKNKEKISRVWIFYDKDSFELDDYDNAKNKIDAKNKLDSFNSDGDLVDKDGIRWEACWSNECFELWILLHFDRITSAISRKNGEKSNNLINMINERLEKRGCKDSYEKNSDNIYDILNEYGDIKKAIKFAKELEKENGTKNPSTGVYKFLEFFDLYLKEAQNKH